MRPSRSPWDFSKHAKLQGPNLIHELCAVARMALDTTGML